MNWESLLHPKKICLARYLVSFCIYNKFELTSDYMKKSKQHKKAGSLQAGSLDKTHFFKNQNGLSGDAIDFIKKYKGFMNNNIYKQ